MTIEFLLFLFGGLLFLIGIIGGGFEVREMKLPKVGWVTRILCMCAGSIFIASGLNSGTNTGIEMNGFSKPWVPILQALFQKPPAQLHGNVTIMWEVNGASYTADLQMHGSTGFMRTKFFQGSQEIKVDQEMVLVKKKGGVFIFGQNPRIGGTQLVANTYSPNALLLGRNDDGSYRVVKLCDPRTSTCVPVTILQLGE